MRIAITLDVYDELADPDHEMGVTTAGYEAILDALSGIGEDIQINPAELV